MNEEVKSNTAQRVAVADNTSKVALTTVESLKQRDERYFKWFHGRIPRNAAENLMQRNGDFLIRESLVNKDEYALTCKYFSAYYNFKINRVKVPTSPTTSATMFCLEDKNFETLLDLVIFYATQRSQVTKKTGVVLRQPVNRTVPLSSAEVPYASLRKGDRFSTADGSKQHRPVNTNDNVNNSNSNISPTQNTTYDIPPKPSRAPSLKSKSPEFSSPSNDSHMAAKQTNTTDSPLSHPSGDNVRMRSRPFSPKKKMDNAAVRRKRASCFKPAQYRCTLLSEENPPLEQRALTEMNKILLRTDPFKLARHMTVMDCKICHIMDDGMEHIFLPHASQLRQDILERYQCIAFWVVICVIKCTGGLVERTEMLNKLIQVANELVHSMGNVFGFSALMQGLNSPQIHSMGSLWKNLERRYTNNAVTFRKKLRPLLHQLDQGKDQIRIAATCIPHIMPLVRLLEHQVSGIPHNTSLDSTVATVLPTSPSADSMELESNSDVKWHWWENVPDESFDSLLHHLHYGRLVVESVDEFKKTANTRLSDFEEIVVVREMFTTDFQMRLLFGFRSSESPREERFDKFDRIITALVRLITD